MNAFEVLFGSLKQMGFQKEGENEVIEGEKKIVIIFIFLLKEKIRLEYRIN